MRNLWFATPLAALCLTAAVLGYQLGEGRPDESTAIARAASIYVSDVPGGDALACAGRPGEGRVWLVIECGLPGSPERRVYAIDRAGEMVPPRGI